MDIMHLTDETETNITELAEFFPSQPSSKKIQSITHCKTETVHCNICGMNINKSRFEQHAGKRCKQWSKFNEL